MQPKRMTPTRCIEHRWRVIQLANQLLSLSEELVSDCESQGCLMLEGVLRDCAYTIRNNAELPLTNDHPLE